MRRVFIVFGTRPETVKMCPVVQELKKRDGIEVKVAVTGQHRQTLFDITTSVLNGVRKVLEKVQLFLVLVRSDTTTTFTTALAAYY